MRGVGRQTPRPIWRRSGRGRRLLSLGAAALLVTLGALLPIPAVGAQAGSPRVGIVAVKMAGPHVLRVELVTSGWETAGTDAPVITLAVWLDGVPSRATLPLLHMPPHFAMDFDLPAGVVRVGGISVGTFQPVPRFVENLRFPVDVTVRQGTLAAAARKEATILLPTVIVPGLLNGNGADQQVLAALGPHGYTDRGPAPTLFWFAYPRDATLEQGAEALAAYVRRVVLPATYAAKINVVGYSAGGLLARWNVAYNVDGWQTLVNRLLLVAVPNEGAVMAYVAGHAPSFLPLAGSGQTALARSLTPTFPFWRAGPAEAWSMPADGQNTLLPRLNAQPIPSGIRVYLFYGSHDPRDSAGPQTMAGLTGQWPAVKLSFEAGDGIVLAASAQGLPMHGGRGVAAFANRPVVRVDLGDVYHLGLLAAAANGIAAALRDRFVDTVDESPLAALPVPTAATTGVQVP